MTIACLVLVYMSWGSCYISVKFALESFPPFLLCGIRMSLAGGILYLATWLYGERTRPTFADCRQCFILAFFMVLISSGFLCKGQETVPSGVAGMFAGMVPIWMVIGGWLFLHEPRPRKLQYIGLAGGTFGILLLSLNQGMSGLTSWWGPVFLLLGTLGWVTGSFYSKVHAGETKLSVMRVSALLMFIGGCAGSTAGGVKVSRIVLLFKGLKRDLRRILHTREVRPITLDGQRVEEDTISSVSLFFFAYMIILFFSALIVSLDELDFTSAFTASLTCISNVGPGLGLVGPTCNFGFLSPLSKLVLSFTMLLGRLEIMPLLVLFLPSVWRKK